MEYGNNNNYNYAVNFRNISKEEAIDIEIEDDNYDIEAGISSSRCRLMHNFEEERPKSIISSIHDSARVSIRKASYYCSYITKPLKIFLSTFKLLMIIAVYSFLGAHLFMWLEVPTDIDGKETAYHKRKIAREVMILNLRAIFYENRDDREERWKDAIVKFEEDLELEEPNIDSDWTFWMSFLYAGTIFTTIGYGNIACKTKAGQIATMLYAFCGIPIMLVMLNSLNNFLLKWIKIIANGSSDIILYIGVRIGFIAIRQDEVQKRLRYSQFAKSLQRWGLASNRQISNSVEDQLGKNDDENDVNEDSEEFEEDPPVYSTLFATIAWIMLSAAVFCMFEDWTYFTSFYFCFISLTTIGLGDVTPANPEYMIATFGVVIIGLSMLTVCIDVIKEKIAIMYMRLLQKLLKDYLEAVKNGDPNAASLMMAGFQGKAKFLMPLISKNEGAKVMNKFKQDCSKKGIEPPSVLTDINLETGMPNFANASRDDYNDYILVAEEKANQLQLQNQRDNEDSKRSSLQINKPRSKSVTAQVGNAWSCMLNSECQTIRLLGHEVYCQTDLIEEVKVNRISLGTQFEKFKQTDQEVQHNIEYKTIGIQPEFSSIYIGSVDDNDSPKIDEMLLCNRSEEDREDESIEKAKMCNLRFMRSVSNQTQIATCDSTTQDDIPSVNTIATQYEGIELRNEKCQTKLSSISRDQLNGLRESLRRKKKKLSKEENKKDSDFGQSNISEVNLDVAIVACGVDEDGHLVDSPPNISKNSGVLNENVNNEEDDNKLEDNAGKMILEEEDKGMTADFGQACHSRETESLLEKVYTEPKDGEDMIEESSTLSSYSDDQYGMMDEEDLSYIEIFSNEASVQTEEQPKYDQQTCANPTILSIIDDASTQTRICSFRQKRSEMSNSKECSSSGHVLNTDGDENNSRPTVNTSDHELDDTTMDINLTHPVDISTQTQQLIMKSASTSLDHSNYSKHSECQTIKEDLEDQNCQTDANFKVIMVDDHINSSTQTMKRECENKETQEYINNDSEYCQTDDTSNAVKEVKTMECQTDSLLFNNAATQHAIDICHEEIQATATMDDQETETIQEQIAEMMDDCTQTQEDRNLLKNEPERSSMEFIDVLCQTDLISHNSASIQCHSSLEECSTQTNLEENSDAATQTIIDKSTSYVQASIGLDTKESQTNEKKVKNKKSQICYDTTTICLSPIFLSEMGGTSDSHCQTSSSSYVSRGCQVDNPEISQGSSGPLWSDFDYVPTIDYTTIDDETQTLNSEPACVDLEIGKEDRCCQVAPERNDAKIQTVKFKKRRSDKDVECRVEMETREVQATVDMNEMASGAGNDDNWLQVYVNELDEERRNNMSDIGIQTGVLARVQHMYTRPMTEDTTSAAPITLRKLSDSSDNLSVKHGKTGSSESLAPSTSNSITESIDDRLSVERTSPFSSRPPSIKRPKSRHVQDVERKIDKTNLVLDLRARFEGGNSAKPSNDAPSGSSKK